MAELYEELKSRVSQFNMHADCRRPVLDREYPHKQRFILQVGALGLLRAPVWDAAASGDRLGHSVRAVGEPGTSLLWPGLGFPCP